MVCSLLIGCQSSNPPATESESRDSSSISESSSSEEVIDTLEEAKRSANEFIASINLNDYIGDERDDLEYLINGLQNLISTATFPDQIYDAIKSIQDYLATVKTKAQHEQEAEEERIRVLNEAKEALLKEVSVERENRFRKEELDVIKAAGNSLKDAINQATTIEELNAISLTEFRNLVASSKTNAEYTMEEWFNYPLDSKWPLVNEHAANWVYENSTFKTKGLGANDVAYMISEGTFNGGFSAVLRCHNTVNASSNFGFLIGNMNSVGTGFDGYLVNYDYNTDHQYLQVWYFDNANGMEAANVYQYIGGWVYQDTFSTKLNQDDIRVIYDGESIKLINNDEYLQKGDLAYTCNVPLEYNGHYSLNPGSDYSIGFFNWDGTNLNSPRILELKEFETENLVVGKEKATYLANKAMGKYDLSIYEDEEKALINDKFDELTALTVSGTYAQIMAKIEEVKTYIKALKTHEEKEAERHPDISTQILDNIYSGDPTKYTPSNWALVDQHALAWNHVQGSHSVVTDGLAGYCMDAANHTNFTLVFKVTGVHNGNPYGGSPSKGLILGGSPSGDYFNGIFVSLSNDWGLQFYRFDENPQGGFGCNVNKFLGGIAMNMEGVTMRFNYVDGNMTIYLVNNDGTETRLSGVVGTYATGTAVDGKNVWDNLNIPTGHFGLFDWGGSSTTFEILEYKDLA